MRIHRSAARCLSLVTVVALLITVIPAWPAAAHRGDPAYTVGVAALPAIGAHVRSSDPGTTLLVSQSGGVQGNGDSEYPAVSADGRYVAFESAASNLVALDSNLKDDMFVYDRTAGAISLTSISTSGVQGTDHSFGAAISADGRYVAFASFARNLADGITTPVGKSQIYRRDRASGTTTLVSAGLSRAGGNGSSGGDIRVAISADGQLVAYESRATDLITADANGVTSDIFVWDATANMTTLVSLSTDGLQGNSDSYLPSLSGVGRYVAYESFATNLTAGGTNGQGQIYVRDRTAATTTKVSVGAGGEGNAESRNGTISADGRFTAFESTSTNLTADPKRVNAVLLSNPSALQWIGWVQVGGQWFQYRAYQMGTYVNIGTVFPVAGQLSNLR